MARTAKARERPANYPKLKDYKPTRFMLPDSHYDAAKADRAVRFIENLCHTKGRWAGKPFWLLLGKITASADTEGAEPPDDRKADDAQKPSEEGLTAPTVTVPDMPVIGMDGKTADGSMPYEILKQQLSFMR